MNQNHSIRPYHPVDLADYYAICRKTGYKGTDASAFFDDPLLLGHVYVGPYVQREPEYALSAEMNGKVIGYVLGTPDSRDFDRYFRKEWIPFLQKRYPRTAKYQPAQQELLSHAVWSQGGDVPGFSSQYPAHLHVDILPAGQGMGLGRKLMEGFMEILNSKGIEGLHFGVDPENAGALMFYRKLGFEQIAAYPGVIYFGRRIYIKK